MLLEAGQGHVRHAKCCAGLAARDQTENVVNWISAGEVKPVLVSHNPSSEVACLVHGNDFLAVGEELALKQFKEQLAKDWKVKHTHIGEAEHLGKHMRVLNRIIRVHPRQGITIEPDPRHAEILIKELDGESGRLMTMPMAKDSVKESIESITDDIHEKARNRKIKGENNGMNDCDKLDDAQITKYRALVV